MSTDKCPECLGQGAYWTEWNDAAEAALLISGIKVLNYPDPPDGTVCIQCTMCDGSNLSLTEASYL